MRTKNFRSNCLAALRPCITGLLLFVCSFPLLAQQPTPTPSPVVIDELAPLPQDTGKAGLQLLLKRLKTTARILHTTAHPDDEDGGMLVLESRGKGRHVTLMSLTRGEGGQNKTGSNLFDELGVLRTLELLASCKYYGTELRFSTAADFGFSKSAEESLQKWSANGVPGYIPLRDMVRVIRTERPDVIISKFQGTARDGHGHHRAAAIITKEAFRAAADPKRFPELNLPPWQAKKLYVGVRDSTDYTVEVDTGVEDPALGMSYVRFALEGLKHQQSQGVGYWNIPAGPRPIRYKLIDSVLPMPKPGEHEKDFFDGIDTSLPALADRLGKDEKRVPDLRTAFAKVSILVDRASRLAEKDPEASVAPLQEALGVLLYMLPYTPEETTSGVEPVSRFAARALSPDLYRLESELSRAVYLAASLRVNAKVAAEGGAPSTFVHPAREIRVEVQGENAGARGVRFAIVGHRRRFLDGRRFVELASGQSGEGEMAVIAAKDHIQRPDFHRRNPERDAVYHNAAPDPTLPFSRGPLTFAVRARTEGTSGPGAEVEVPLQTELTDVSGRLHRRPLAVAPKFSVLLEPATQIIPASNGAREVTVEVRSINPKPVKGMLRLEIPEGWRAEPKSESLSFEKYGDERHAKFRVIPSQLKEGKSQVRAVFESEGKQYTEGYTTVQREDISTYYYYQPSIQRISIVDVKTQPGLKVGYIMGAGDDIPTVLRQLGIDVTSLSPEELATGDLSRYGTIVLGIRTYDVRGDVKQHNQRLLEYVKNGGTLIMQYDSDAGGFTPYPVTMSRDRVSVEDAPVTILEPENPIFRTPNQITAGDFDGWVQERGLYFMGSWDAQYRPLLSSHDPDEPERKGGMLEAKYGKGTYIYTGYAFFRQLPAGVPGAVRLFVNLLSAGH